MPSDSACDEPGDADLVDHLGELARARPAHQRDGAPVVGEHVLGLRRSRRLAADHDRQLAVLGARLAAGHRRIEESDAAACRRRVDLARDLGRRGRVVDEDRARRASPRARRSPSATARTSSSLPTHIMTMSASRAASAGVAAARAAVLRDPARRLRRRAVVDGDGVAGAARWPAIG